MNNVIGVDDCPSNITIDIDLEDNDLLELGKLGFEFGKSNTVCNIPVKQVPDGWTLRLGDGVENNIEAYDGDGIKRAGFNIVISRFCTKTHIYPRFEMIDDVIGNTNICHVRDMKTGRSIKQFSAVGIYSIEARSFARKWLKGHYSNWENPAAYWEDE